MEQRAQRRGASGSDGGRPLQLAWHGFNFQPICYLKQITEGTAQLSS